LSLGGVAEGKYLQRGFVALNLAVLNGGALVVVVQLNSLVSGSTGLILSGVLSPIFTVKITTQHERCLQPEMDIVVEVRRGTMSLIGILGKRNVFL